MGASWPGLQLGFAALAIWLAAAGQHPALASAGKPPQTGRDAPIHVWMRDVVLHPYDDAPARVASLNGTVEPSRRGGLVVFDDVNSYAVRADHAEVHLSAASLTVLMNRYVLPSANGPIKEITVSFGDGRMGMKGTMVKAGAPIPFEAVGVPEPTAEGDMRVRIVEMTAAGIVPKGLMDLLGIEMSDVAQPDNTRVLHIVGNDMILPLSSVFPPPKVLGRLRSVAVTPQAMVAVIGAAAPTARSGVDEKSYLHFRGGVMKFARLTMEDVDMTIVSKDRKGPLGFSAANYYSQPQAGFTVPQPDRGLVAHVPDYGASR